MDHALLAAALAGSIGYAASCVALYARVARRNRERAAPAEVLDVDVDRAEGRDDRDLARNPGAFCERT